MTTAWYPGYRDEFSGGLYPFADTATLVSDDGVIMLLPGMILDAAIYPVGGGPRARIAGLVVSPGQVILILGDENSVANGSVSFDPASPPPTLLFTDSLGRPAGMLIIDRSAMTAAQTWPTGSYSFKVGALEFVARCCFPVPDAGLAAFLVNGTPVAGDVWLVGGPGVILSQAGAGVIQVDIVGDPLSSRQNCLEADLFTTPRFIQRLAVSDGVLEPVILTPDEQGGVQLVVGNQLAADTALRLVGIPSAGLRLSVVGKSLAQ